MNLQTYFRVMDVIKKIEEKFNTKAVLYFDEYFDEYSIAISNMDIYLSNEMSDFNAEVAKEFTEEKILVICLSESMLKNHKERVEWSSGKSVIRNVTISHLESASNARYKSNKIGITYNDNFLQWAA